MLELKNVKTSSALSQETLAFTASVYWKGKKVGDARNDGNGGSSIVHLVVVKKVKGKNEFVHVDADTRKEIEDFVSSKTWGDDWTHTLDSYVDELAEKYESDKWNQRQCKNKIVVKLEGKPEGEYITFKAVFNAETKKKVTEMVEAKGEKIEYILNEKIGQKAW